MMPKAKAPIQPLPPLSEADILRAVVEAAAVFGVTLVRRNVGMATNAKGQRVRFGRPGESDLYADPSLPDGRRFEVETKRRGKRPTPKQLDFLQRINAAGHVGMWIDSVTEFARVLPKILAGARVEIEPDGRQYLVTDD
jgi:hypothetical protein